MQSHIKSLEKNNTPFHVLFFYFTTHLIEDIFKITCISILKIQIKNNVGVYHHQKNIHSNRFNNKLHLTTLYYVIHYCIKGNVMMHNLKFRLVQLH